MTRLLELLWQIRKLFAPKWNKGYCSKCKCKWEFFSYSRPGYSLFTCAHGHTIERITIDSDPMTTDIQSSIQ